MMKKFPFLILLSLMLVVPLRGMSITEEIEDISKSREAEEKEAQSYSEMETAKTLASENSRLSNEQIPTGWPINFEGDKSSSTKEETSEFEDPKGLSVEDLLNPTILAKEKRLAEETLSILITNRLELEGIDEATLSYWEQKRSTSKAALKEARSKELLNDIDLGHLQELVKEQKEIVFLLSSLAAPLDQVKRLSGESVSSGASSDETTLGKSIDSNSSDNQSGLIETKNASEPSTTLQLTSGVTPEVYKSFWKEWNDRGEKLRLLREAEQAKEEEIATIKREKDEAIAKVEKEKEELAKNKKSAEQKVWEQRRSLYNVNPINPWSKERRTQRLNEAEIAYQHVEAALNKAEQKEKNLLQEKEQLIAKPLREKERLIQAEKPLYDWEGFFPKTPERDRGGITPEENEIFSYIGKKNFILSWKSALSMVTRHEIDRLRKNGVGLIIDPASQKPILNRDGNAVTHQANQAHQELNQFLFYYLTKSLLPVILESDLSTPKSWYHEDLTSLVNTARSSYEVPQSEQEAFSSLSESEQNKKLEKAIKSIGKFVEQIRKNKNAFLENAGKKLVKGEDPFSKTKNSLTHYNYLMEVVAPRIKLLKLALLPTVELERETNRIASLSLEEWREELRQEVGITEGELTEENIFSIARKAYEAQLQKELQKEREKAKKDLEKAQEAEKEKQQKEQAKVRAAASRAVTSSSSSYKSPIATPPIHVPTYQWGWGINTSTGQQGYVVQFR